MEQKSKKEILIYILLGIASLCCFISLIYMIYLPIVFKTGRIFILMFGITLMLAGIIIILTRLLFQNEKIKKYLQVAILATIIASIVFSVSFAIPFAKSKRSNIYVQNKKGLSIENNNFFKRYQYYLYSQKVIQQFPVGDNLVIDKSRTNKKIRVIKKTGTINVGKDKIAQNLTTMTVLSYERYEKENTFSFDKDNVLHIERTSEPKINAIHKMLLPSVFSQRQEKGEIVLFVPPHVTVTYI